MRIALLGTGGPSGVPEALCACAGCATVLADGAVRGPSAALVDEALLLDEPEGPTAFARAGCSARRIAVRAAARPGGVPASTGAYALSELAGGMAGRTAIDVVGPDGHRLLWAPSGLAPDAQPTGCPYTTVLLGAADGDVTAPGVGHALARLRAGGVVTDETVVVAVGIGHRTPPRGLAERLAAWGVRVVPDGAVLAAGTSPSSTLSGRTLFVGGARSGKSAAAERLLAGSEKVTYVATAPPRDDDAEWAARVAAHRERRPAMWTTLETLDVAGVLRAADSPVLVDCLSLWLAAVLDEVGAWSGTAGADDALRRRVDDLLDAWRSADVPVVAVTSEVGSGVVPATASGRRYRDELGRLNARVAAECEHVTLVVAGRAVPLGTPA